MATFRTNDVTIAYHVTGCGPPVLLIQGIGVTGSGWRPQVEALSGRYTIATFDNRGIGDSTLGREKVTVEAMAKDAAALLEHLGWDSAHVAGHSMGGSIALQLALDHPQKVQSLSLICTFAQGKDGAKPSGKMIWLGLRSRIGSKKMRRRAFLEMLWPLEALDKLDCEVLAADLAPTIGRDLSYFPPIINKQLKALSKHDISHRLNEIAGIPALVISGKHDPIATPASGRRLASLITETSYSEFEDGSHGLTIQHAQKLNQMLDRFWSQHSNGQ